MDSPSHIVLTQKILHLAGQGLTHNPPWHGGQSLNAVPLKLKQPVVSLGRCAHCYKILHLAGRHAKHSNLGTPGKPPGP